MDTDIYKQYYSSLCEYDKEKVYRELWEEEFAEGYAEGYNESVMEENVAIANRMLDRHYPLEEIADILGLTLTEVTEIAKSKKPAQINIAQ